MKATVTISSYIDGRYNSTKLEKLKAELEKAFKNVKQRTGQEIPEEGLEVTIGMSAKYGTPYVTVEGWGDYQAVGQFEDAVKEALENRGFEVTEEGDDEDKLKISFE